MESPSLQEGSQKEPLPETMMTELTSAIGAARLWLLEVPRAVVVGEVLGLPAGAELPTPLGGQPITCCDLKAQAAAARQGGVPMVADGGICGVWGSLPLRLGAQVLLVELSDSRTLVAVARAVEQVLPGISKKFDALPSVKGPAIGALLESLMDARRQWRDASDAAQVVASYLRCHPQVSGVRYPGLKGDPSFEIAARTLQQGFGPVLDYRRVSSSSWNRLVCDGQDPRVQIEELERSLAGLQGQ